jgi:phosphoribosylanthranilate isomerase
VVKVKICGITRRRDAEAAVEFGADALGFIFAVNSPRRVEIGKAREIIQSLPPFVVPVGVFVNASRDAINRTVDATGIRALQFHGDETPADVKGYDIPTYKAFHVAPGFDVWVLEEYKTTAHLLDTFSADSFGGTGTTFDWTVAVKAKAFGRIILSGGLNPGNIAEAIKTVRPYAVDINSGVESSPGIKDGERIRSLFHELKMIAE